LHRIVDYGPASRYMLTCVPEAVGVTHPSTTAFTSADSHRRAQLEPFLKACGFRDTAIQWLPAVGPTGQNLVASPTQPELARWWRGPTVVGAVDRCVRCLNHRMLSAQGHKVFASILLDSHSYASNASIEDDSS